MTLLQYRRNSLQFKMVPQRNRMLKYNVLFIFYDPNLSHYLGRLDLYLSTIYLGSLTYGCTSHKLFHLKHIYLHSININTVKISYS
jgi:hypothetical protein